MEILKDKENGYERLSRFGRDLNILGALALVGTAAVLPGPNAILAGWAALNTVQAAGFEWVRHSAEKKRKKKKKSTLNRSSE